MEGVGGFVGIDVGKDFVDVATGAESPRRYSNDEAGIGEVVAALRASKPQLVVMEASGGYQRHLLASLCAAGIAAVAVNPRQVRDFAKAVGRLEKTDRSTRRSCAFLQSGSGPRCARYRINKRSASRNW